MSRLLLLVMSIAMSLLCVQLRVTCQVGTWTTYTNVNHVNDIAREGDTLWVATSGGVVAFNANEMNFMRTVTNIDGLAHVSSMSVVIDRKGHVWFGTDGGGISKWRRSANAWRTYTEFDGVALHVRTLWQDGTMLWVGSDEGISFFQVQNTELQANNKTAISFWHSSISDKCWRKSDWLC